MKTLSTKGKKNNPNMAPGVRQPKRVRAAQRAEEITPGVSTRAYKRQLTSQRHVQDEELPQDGDAGVEDNDASVEDNVAGGEDNVAAGEDNVAAGEDNVAAGEDQTGDQTQSTEGKL